MNLNTVGRDGKPRLKSAFSSDDDEVPLTLSQKFLRFLDFKDTTSSDDDELTDITATQTDIEIGPARVIPDETTETDGSEEDKTDTKSRTSPTASTETSRASGSSRPRVVTTTTSDEFTNTSREGVKTSRGSTSSRTSTSPKSTSGPCDILTRISKLW